MATLAPATELRRRTGRACRRSSRSSSPLASLLVALTLLGAGARLLIVVALPVLC